MTCIIGAVEKGKVYMGGDSATASGWEVRAAQGPKVFRTGPFLIGITGYIRVAQLLQHEFIPPERNGQSVMKYMCTSFVSSVREVFKQGGYATIKDSKEEGGTFLTGWEGHLYLVDSNFQVTEFRDGYNAIGSGSTYALGAYRASTNLEPRARILQSLKISAYFSGSVMGPFKVLEL